MSKPKKKTKTKKTPSQPPVAAPTPPPPPSCDPVFTTYGSFTLPDSPVQSDIVNQTLTTSENTTTIVSSAAVSGPTETVCEKARRLAREEKMKRERDEETEKREFFVSLGLDIETVPRRQVKRYILGYDVNSTAYEICGHEWFLECATNGLHYLKAANFYRGREMNLRYRSMAFDTIQLGEVLLHLDAEKARIDAYLALPWYRKFWLWLKG